MTPNLPNLSGQEDVYSVHTTEHALEASLVQVEITVVLERLPGALARVFALLCLFELVPQFARIAPIKGSGIEDDIRLEFGFAQLQPERLDLLCRKIRQLTECLEVFETDSGSVGIYSTQAIVAIEVNP